MKKYLEVIKEKNPELIIDTFSFNNEGQNNDVVIINNNYIFKFPKYIEGIEKLKREVKILHLLKKYISLDTPNPQYTSLDPNEVGYVYSGYKMIHGVTFRKEIFSNVQNKGIIVEQLATFLKELHNIPLNEIEEFQIDTIDSDQYWTDLYEKAQKQLFPFMKKESQKMVTKNFNDFLNQSSSFNTVVIHGDFGPSNILFDRDNQLISGIIDFNEVSIGDSAIDFASLIGPFGYGEEFIRRFEPIYPNVDKLLNRSRFYASTFALQEALFGIEVGDKEAFKAGIKPYL